MKDLDEEMRQSALENGLGKTGEYPQGRFNDEDEGELTLGIGCKNGAVVVNFGTSVTWFAMTPEHAETVAEGLRESAAMLRRTAQAKQGGIN